MDSDKNEIGIIVKILSNEIRKKMNTEGSKYGVTGIQSRVIHYVSKQERDVFQKDIESAFQFRRSTVTGILQLMEENGLIRRESVDYDARLKKIVITEKGLCIKAHISEDIKNIEKKLKKGLSENEINTFFSVADKMINNLK